MRIQGALTKPSSVYVAGLAEHFALAFVAALDRIDQKERNGFSAAGLESVFLNDLLMTGSWTTDLKWNWKYATHINLLESNSYVTLLKMLASSGISGRSPVFWTQELQRDPMQRVDLLLEPSDLVSEEQPLSLLQLDCMGLSVSLLPG